MSDPPSNPASEALLASGVFLSAGPPSAALLRSLLTDDYTYEDRRRHGVSFPAADAASYPDLVVSAWQIGSGRPRFEVLEILAVRGDRFVAGLVRIDYGDGMLFESIHILALDPTLTLMQREVDFDPEDIDAAIEELDRLHRQTESPSSLR
jgi:hypothetical protein